MDGDIACVLFDFGDTIAREPFFTHAPAGCPDWAIRVAAAIDPETADRWSLGALSFDQLTDQISDAIGLPGELVRQAMRRDCRDLSINERVLDFARHLSAASVPIALVTVNPDLFSQVIAPRYGLNSIFSVVVTSWEEKLLDKTALCRIAINRIEPRPLISSTLLIDNILANAEAFERAGGRAYHFRGETRFIDDLIADPLLARLDRGAAGN